MTQIIDATHTEAHWVVRSGPQRVTMTVGPIALPALYPDEAERLGDALKAEAAKAKLVDW